MNIKNAIITFWFKKQDDITQYMNTLNNELKHEFFPLNVIGVPITFDPTFPRMTTTSNGGHSTIEFSLINYRITTNFDENFNTEPEKCVEYLKDKAETAFSLLKKLKIDVLYSAIFVTLEKKASDPVKQIALEFLNKDKYATSEEIGIRLTEIIDNKYYKILNVNNNKTFKYTIQSDINSQKSDIILPLMSFDSATDVEDYLVTSIELNDKLSYNNNHTYISTKEDLICMVDMTLNEIKNEIARF